MQDYPKIDKDFAAYLPPLDSETFAKLEAKLLKEGCREELVVWKETDILVEGHHRLKICKKHGLPYRTRKLSFDGRQAVEEWIRDNQLARRNLTDEQRAYYIGKKYTAARQSHGGDRSDGASRHNDDLKTSEIIGQNHGVSARTVERDAAFAEAVDNLPPKQREAVLTGNSGRTKAEIINGAAPKLLCRPCRVSGNPKKGCEECAALNAPAERVPRDDTESEAAAEKERREHKRDAEGHIVPEISAAAFANLEAFARIDALCRSLQKEVDALVRLPGGEQLARCTKAVGEEGKTIQRLPELDSIKRHLKGTRPHAICPYCQGKGKKGCNGCNGTGWVTKTTWAGAEDALKARIK